MSAPRLIVGLGNPGNDYENTRHNIGFMAVDALAEKHGATLWKKKFKSLLAAAPEAGLLFLKPQTYMNLSGEAVVEAAHFHKITPDNIIVIHDELDLPPATIRVKQGGGAGGHNGLKSIDAHIGKDYWRIRLGIGRPEHKDYDVSDYVLGTFTKADAAWLASLLKAITGEFDILLNGKPNDFQSRVARKLADALPKPP